MTNGRQGTLYVGVTSDLVRRVWEHRTGVEPGFTTRYSCKLLAWFEVHDEMTWAIAREKQIKGGSRAKKIGLIEDQNAEWRDLYADIAQ